MLIFQSFPRFLFATFRACTTGSYRNEANTSGPFPVIYWPTVTLRLARESSFGRKCRLRNGLWHASGHFTACDAATSGLNSIKVNVRPHKCGGPFLGLW